MRGFLDGEIGDCLAQIAAVVSESLAAIERMAPGTPLAFKRRGDGLEPAGALTTSVNPMPDATAQLRILVIDDSVDNAEALCALLSVMGCLTAVAYSGVDGLATAAEFDPHLAIIDLEMPGMGGCEVACHLRAIRSIEETKLICLTGRGHPDDRRKCLGAGFDDFFTKPMAPDSLERVLAESSVSR